MDRGLKLTRHIRKFLQLQVVKTGGTSLATLYTRTADGGVGEHVADLYSDSEYKLLASSPEMYAALIHVLEASEDGGKMSDIDFDFIRRAVRSAAWSKQYEKMLKGFE